MAKKEAAEKENEGLETEEDEKQEKKKGFPLKLVILLVAVLGLGGGGFFVWQSGTLKGLLGDDKPAHAAKGVAKEAGMDMGPIRSLDTFIVNLADPLGKRYLKVRMDLELTDEKMLPEIEKRLPQLKDTIVTTLSSKTYDDINTLEGKMHLRMEMMVLLNQHLKSGKVKNIFFTEFIVQ